MNFTNYSLFVDRKTAPACVSRVFCFILAPRHKKMCVEINGALQHSVFAKWYAVKTFLKQADKKSWRKSIIATIRFFHVSIWGRYLFVSLTVLAVLKQLGTYRSCLYKSSFSSHPAVRLAASNGSVPCTGYHQGPSVHLMYLCLLTSGHLMSSSSHRGPE